MTGINRQSLFPTNYDDLRLKLNRAQRAFPYCRPGQAVVNAFGTDPELEAQIYEEKEWFKVYAIVMTYALEHDHYTPGL